MSRKIILLIILVLMTGTIVACNKNIAPTAIPENNGYDQQADSTANDAAGSDVSKGPPVEEYYDPNQPELKIKMIYVTSTGITYHRAGCRYLANDKIAMSLDEARAEGYTPCPLCKPPEQ